MKGGLERRSEINRVRCWLLVLDGETLALRIGLCFAKLMDFGLVLRNATCHWALFALILLDAVFLVQEKCSRDGDNFSLIAYNRVEYLQFSLGVILINESSPIFSINIKFGK